MTMASIKAVLVAPNTNEFVIVFISKLLTFLINNFALLLECILSIYHLIPFKKDQAKVQALLNSGSEVNTMTLANIAWLNLKIWPTNIRAQKIDGFRLKIFRMILASFQVNNKLVQSRFFQKTFWLANTSIKIILGMFFLIYSNADLLFAEQKLT